MRNLVLTVAVAAIACAALAVAGMVAIGFKEGDGLATTVIGDLQAIAMAVIPTIAVVISHYIGSQSAVTVATSSPPAAPAPAPEPPADSGGA